MKASEAFNTNTHEEWRQLPLMQQERSNFNPCANQQLIYLPGGLAATSIEIYHPKDNAFLPIPNVQLRERQATISWIDNGLLTIISRQWVTTLDLGKQSAEAESVPHRDTEFYSKSHPVIARGYAYFVDHDNQIFSVQVDCSPVVFSKSRN